MQNSVENQRRSFFAKVAKRFLQLTEANVGSKQFLYTILSGVNFSNVKTMKQTMPKKPGST